MIKRITAILAFLFSFIVLFSARTNLTIVTVKQSSILKVKPKASVKSSVDTTFIPIHNSPKGSTVNIAALSRISSIVNAGIVAKAYSGCQVLVLKDGKTVYDKCFGYYTYDNVQKVKSTTMYDLASLTKTTGTLLAIMKLYDDKKLNLNDKASKYLSFLRGTNKENITITDLLFHETGLPGSLPFYRLILNDKSNKLLFSPQKDSIHVPLVADNLHAVDSHRFKEGWVSNTYSNDYNSQVAENFFVNKRFHQAAMEMIANTKLYRKSYLYSDLNFILLKEIAETISGVPLDAFLNTGFFIPMKLNYLSYLPLRTHKQEEIAPTAKSDFIRGKMIPGYVNDESAAFLGGVSGNAGLFASAGNVASIYQMILNGGEMDGVRYISKETCRIFTTTTSASGRRGLGYDKPIPSNPKLSPCCISTPYAVYGHTGYTGTCCWVDPVNKLVYVFLSNRTYPSARINKLLKMGIRSRIQEVIYKSLR